MRHPARSYLEGSPPVQVSCPPQRSDSLSALYREWGGRGGPSNQTAPPVSPSQSRLPSVSFKGWGQMPLDLLQPQQQDVGFPTSVADFIKETAPGLRGNKWGPC